MPVAGHFFYPLLKYFEQKEKDELILAHVIHALACVIHCATLATVRLVLYMVCVAIVTNSVLVK